MTWKIQQTLLRIITRTHLWSENNPVSSQSSLPSTATTPAGTGSKRCFSWHSQSNQTH